MVSTVGPKQLGASRGLQKARVERLSVIGSEQETAVLPTPCQGVIPLADPGQTKTEARLDPLSLERSAWCDPGELAKGIPRE